MREYRHGYNSSLRRNKFPRSKSATLLPPLKKTPPLQRAKTSLNLIKFYKDDQNPFKKWIEEQKDSIEMRRILSNICSFLDGKSIFNAICSARCFYVSCMTNKFIHAMPESIKFNYLACAPRDPQYLRDSKNESALNFAYEAVYISYNFWKERRDNCKSMLHVSRKLIKNRTI